MSAPSDGARADARKRLALDDFEYTLTRNALRQIKAESWVEGHLDVCSDCCCPPDRNPYRSESGR